MITLTPRTYNKESKYSLITDNSIDTVVIQPADNTLTETQVIHEESIKDVLVNGKTYTLPLSNDMQPTYFRTLSNRHWVNIFHGNIEFAKSRMECILVSGRVVCKLENPLPGIPTVSVTLQGTSDVVARGEKDYFYYPELTSMQDINVSLSNWIAESKTETLQYLSHNYSDNVFSLNPWIKKVVPVISAEENNTQTTDILTKWWEPNPDATYYPAFADPHKWVETGNIPFSNYPSIKMHPPGNTVNMGTYDCDISMHAVSYDIKCSIDKIDDYTYAVAYTVPVRVAYAAASRYVLYLGDKKQLDNYAFLDKVSEIVIGLHAMPLSTNTRDITYSLQDGELTTEAIVNKNTLEIDAEGLLTLDTYYGYEEVDKFDPETVTKHYKIIAGGELEPDEEQFVTDYIEVPPGSYVNIPVTTTQDIYHLGVVYDYNKQYKATIAVPTPELIQDNMFPAKNGTSEIQYFRCNGAMTLYEQNKYTLNGRFRRLWTTEFARNVLKKYEKGKYTFDCEVPAEWAIRNKIKVNTQVQIQLLGGKLLSRKDNVCVFEIKNITKKYDKYGFVYTLKLLET